MKKAVSWILTLMMVCSVFVMPVTASASEESGTAKYYYVAKDGDDGSDGSEAAPFKTLEAARDKIRAEGVPQGGVTVYVRGGTYVRTTPFELLEQDSGTAENPVIYAAYPGETAIFSGAAQLDNSKFQPVTDPAMIDRLPDASKVMVYDLQAEGIPTGEIPRKMLGQPAEPASPEVFVNNVSQVLARYPNVNAADPNAEYMKPAGIIEEGFNSDLYGIGKQYPPDHPDYVPPGQWKDQTPPTFLYNDARMDKWALEDEPFLFGYFRFDWSDTPLLIADINTTDKTLAMAYPPTYGVTNAAKFYGFNLLCELDTEGEYYIDRTEIDGTKTDKLYLYVGKGLENKNVEITVLGSQIVAMSGAKHVTFRGIDFTKNQADAIFMRNCENCTIADSEIYDNGGWGVNIDGGRNNAVDGCYMHGTGTGGVYMFGGNFETLTSSGHIVQNCEFYEFSRIKRTYSPAVSAQGVGQIVRRNYIHDGPHNAILFGGNDQLIEFNEIENVLYETGDAGAIYCGRDWTCRGNVIRYNYLHDIPNPSSTTFGIYLDDAFSSAEIYGNVFENFEKTACMMGGGRDNLFHDNIYINIQGGVYSFDARTFDGWYNNEQMVPNYNAKPITNEYWMERYPELAETYGHLVIDKSLANAENPDLLNPLYPVGNKVYNEAIVSSSFGKIVPMVQKYGTIDINPPSYENSQNALEIYHRTLKKTTTSTAEALDAAKAAYLADLDAAERDTILKGTPVVDGVLDDMYKESTQLKFNPKYTDTSTWTATDQGDNTGDLYTLWDEDYLYIFAVVNDKEVVSHGSQYAKTESNPWLNDAVEIFTNNYKVSVDAFGMRTFTHQNQFTDEELNALPRATAFLKDGEVIQYSKNLDLENLPEGYTVEGANGYTVEMAIPIAKILGSAPKVGDNITVQAQNNDLLGFKPGATPDTPQTPIVYYSVNEGTMYTLGISPKVPAIAEGKETQTGEAAPASSDGSVPAVPYTADLSGWFIKNSESALSYLLVSALASNSVQQNAADVSARVAIDGDSLTYTPSAEEAGKTVTIRVCATDDIWNSEPVILLVQVAEVPSNALDTKPLDEAIAGAENAQAGITVSKDGKDVPKGNKWVVQEALDALNAAVQEAKQAKKNASSQEDLTAAAEKLNKAVQVFDAAKAEGTKTEGSAENDTPSTDTPATGGSSLLQLAILLLMFAVLCGSAIWLQRHKEFQT